MALLYNLSKEFETILSNMHLNQVHHDM